MSYREEESNNAIIIHLVEDIDLEKSDDLRSQATDCLGKTKQLSFDMSKVNYIDSSGVSVLIELNQMAGEASKKFIIQSPSEQVTSVLKMAKLFEFFTIIS